MYKTIYFQRNKRKWLLDLFPQVTSLSQRTKCVTPSSLSCAMNSDLVLFQSKPITIRQAKLDSMLHGSRSPSPDTEVPRPLTHAEEQENLRKETITAFHAAVPESDDFLIPRDKTKDEIETEEAEYRAFLEREVGDIRGLVSIDRYPEVSTLGAIGEVGSEDGGAEEFERRTKKNLKKSKVDISGMNQKKTKAEEDQEFLMK